MVPSGVHFRANELYIFGHVRCTGPEPLWPPVTPTSANDVREGPVDGGGHGSLVFAGPCTFDASTWVEMSPIGADSVEPIAGGLHR
jgi:hypothetical protein